MASERRRARFRTRVKAAPIPENPESLFGELPRTPAGVGALWSHQADILRTYSESHIKTHDVALELPTGSGKTLVGLLIAEWRRRALNHRIVYTCPTKQLARQVQEAARAQQIPVVQLVGPSRSWSSASIARYTGGKAIAVSTYSHIFNINSRFADAQSLVFDDAHAAEGYVAEAWALNIEESDSAYADLLDTIRDDLDPHFVARVTNSDYTMKSISDVSLIPIPVIDRRITEIDEVLSASLTGSDSLKFRMIRAALRSCLFYLTPVRWYIRPFIPPTFSHAPFTDPSQRLYLSATLGESGELERTFGRAPIERVAVPPAWERTGSGRRFFVFPDLAERPEDTSVEDVTRDILRVGPKRLILAPDNRTTQEVLKYLEVSEGERFTAQDEAGLRPFIDAAQGILIAPNRYDGMDLPGESCNLLLLVGLPDALHPQDRFLVSRLRANTVLQERIRTRITQGAGRCTRGPKDHAVVVVQGSDLLRFLSQSEVQHALPVELQAEIKFGLHTSEVPAGELIDLVRSAFEQDTLWQEEAEPEIAELRRDAEKSVAPETVNLRASASREVDAWRAAWQEDWDGAARLAYEVLERLTATNLRPYRALWAYFASAWSTLAALRGAQGAAERAEKLLRIAHKAAGHYSWLREIEPLTGTDAISNPIDDVAVSEVLALLDGSLKSATRFDSVTSKMLAGLARPDASHYEQALVTLGVLLGADSTKPESKGRADAVWVWPGLWVTLESKSESQAGGGVSLKYVRQANTHLDSLRADRGEDVPEGSVSLIISPRRVIDPDAVPVAARHVYLINPEGILDAARDVVRAWKRIRIEVSASAGEVRSNAVSGIFWGYHALPTQVVERLTTDPIRSV